MNIYVDLEKNAYDIVIERGALKKAGEYLNLKRKVFIVTDGGVPEAYVKQVASCCDKAVTVTVNEGESSKSITVWENLLKRMLAEHFTRSDAVVAVGGGVVGDLAGFTASAFMRGIDFYNIPTTLLSQVDSSVGGKTAVNLGGVKNIVGAFYQPKKVLIDPDVLQTLNLRQLAAGMAESVKMAACFDKELFEQIETGAAYEDLDTIIQKSIAIKADVVIKDEKEKGLRRVLNFGHTIGHGIEAQGGLYHGECVALGMLPMCSATVKRRLEAVYRKYGLPLSTDVKADSIIAAMEHDKKLEGDTLNAVYVDTIGSFEMKQISIEAFKKQIKDYYS